MQGDTGGSGLVEHKHVKGTTVEVLHEFHFVGVGALTDNGVAFRVGLRAEASSGQFADLVTFLLQAVNDGIERTDEDVAG